MEAEPGDLDASPWGAKSEKKETQKDNYHMYSPIGGF